MTREVDVAIVGGGITGASLLYILSNYTDINKIELIEKYGNLATLNTNLKNNSQTIHCGDIETNYTFEKAKKVKRDSDMMKNYGINYNLIGKSVIKGQKLALAVGDIEVKFMTERFEKFKTLYKGIKFFTKDEIKKIEPLVVLGEDGKDRPENIVAMGYKDDYTTIDYGAISCDMVKRAKAIKDKEIDITFNTKVGKIVDDGDHKLVHLPNGDIIKAKFVAVCAGAHSLLFAHRYGVGKDFSCFPVAGSFYQSNKHSLNGKVYMIQNPKLPFAALHGDPDLTLNGNCRFGPTALVLPKLERYKSGTYLDFWRSFRFDGTVLKVLLKLLADSEIRNYLILNYIFEIPFIGKKLFVRDSKKIIPSIKSDDIVYAKKYGGVRPQIINKTKKELMLGEARLESKGILFNITPSPGATTSISNAERDTKIITEFLGKTFDIKKFEANYTKEVK